MSKLKKTFLFMLLSGIMLNIYACGVKNNVNQSDNTLQKTEWSEERIGYVNTDTLKMRKEPFEDADVVTLLKKEQPVNILAEQNEFYQILIQAEDETEETLEGYVKKEYIIIE